MPVGQDLEYLIQYDMARSIQETMLPVYNFNDELLDSDDETYTENQDTTKVSESEIFDIILISEDDKSIEDGSLLNFQEQEAIVEYFEGDEELVSPEENDEYFHALDSQLSFIQSVEKEIILLRTEKRRNRRTLSMMTLSSLVQEASSDFLEKLEMKLLVDAVMCALKEYNDITMMTNALCLLKHVQQTHMMIAVNGAECMEVLSRNSRRHGPPECIELSLDIVKLGHPKFGLSHPESFRSLQFCLGIHSLLSIKAQKIILCLLSKSKEFINIRRTILVERFLTKFLMDLPRTNKKEDVEFRDEIISYIRDIYVHVMNDPEIVNGITSQSFVKDLHDLLKNGVVGMTDSHKIMEILSIIGVHSESISLALMRMGIAKTLLTIYEEYFTTFECHKLDLVTLVWSLMPNLSEEYNCNKLIRLVAIKTLKGFQWQRLIDGEWVPFTPKLNMHIERFYRKKETNRVLIIESDSVCEVILDKMVHLDHSTDEQTDVRRLQTTVYEVLKLEKTKKSTGNHLKTDFVDFAFMLLNKSSSTSFHSMERYQSLEALLVLVLNMTKVQHDKIVAIPRNYTALKTVLHLKELMYRFRNDECGILAMQVVTALIRRFPDMYEEICMREGVRSTMQLVLKAVEEKQSIALLEIPREDKSRFEDTAQVDPDLGSSNQPHVNLPQVHPAQINPLQMNPTQGSSTPENPAQVSTQQVNRAQVNPSQVNLAQVNTPQVNTPQVTTPQVITPQVTTPQVNTPQVNTPQVNTPQVNTPQVNTPQVTTPQVNTPQVNTTQVTTPQVTTPQVTTPQVTTPQVNTAQVNPPQGNPSKVNLPKVVPSQGNPTQGTPTQGNPSQESPQNPITTPENDGRNSFRNQVDYLVKCIRKEAAEAPVLPNNKIRTKPQSNLWDAFNEIKKSLMDNTLTSYEIRCTGAVPKLFRILTGTNYEDILNHKLRTFLNVFANLPVDENGKMVEIVSAPFNRLVHILNDAIKYIYQYDNNWPYTYSTRSIYAAGVRTIGKISEKRLQVSIKSVEDDSVVFTNSVFPFTMIQYLENLVMHKMRNQKEEYRGWNETVTTRIVLFLHGSPVPSQMTLFEAIRRYRGNRQYNVFEHDHVFTCTEINVSDVNTMRYHDPKKNPLGSYFSKMVSLSISDEYYEQVMQLLQILYGLNRYWGTLYKTMEHQFIIDSKNFVNKNLDHSLNNALIDPFNALLSTFPDWVNIILRCPFFFSIKTRKLAFRVLCLDRHRALRIVMEHYQAYSSALIFDTHYPLITVDRSNVIDDVHKALLHTLSFSSWNVLFKGENGTGIGLKRELYSMVGKELQKQKHGIWIAPSTTKTGYIHGRELYPDFNLGLNDGAEEGFDNASVVEKFNIIGKITGKALMEGRFLDLPLSMPVLKWLMKEESQLTIYDLKHVDEGLFKTLITMQELLDEQERISIDISLSPEAKATLLKNLDAEWECIESYYLVFVVPNHNVELIRGGADILVTRHNAAQYISGIKNFLLHLGVQNGMNAFRTGFNDLLDVDCLKIFEPQELKSMICGEDNDEYWTVAHLRKYVMLNGFGAASPEVQRLFEILSTLSSEKRGQFLEFVTGCPRLPADGFAGLTPPLTLRRFNGYPYAQTCFHILNLTGGISKEKLEEFIHVAISHGLGYFGIV